MDEIQAIVQTLEPEDIKDFKTFVNRLKKKSQRLDLDLFELLLQDKEWSRDELMGILYPEKENLEAYHATRKRLIKQLTEFIYVKRIKEDPSQISQILGLLSLVNYLFEKKEEKTAWNYLKKVEQIAINGKYFEILNNVYSIQLSYAESDYAPDLQTILRKKETNKVKAILEDNSKTAYQIIKHTLNQSMQEGTEVNIDFLVKKTLMDYDLSQASMESPRIMYNIIAITRQAFLSRKDFFAFEPYILTKYNELKHLFNKTNHEYKVNMLYWISHVLYRNRKFEDSEKFLEELYQNLFEFNKSQFYKLIEKYYLLKAANRFFKNDLSGAIAILNEYLEKYPGFDKKHLLNSYLNLAVYHFFGGDFDTANKVFLNIHHSDKWCAKKMGKEWVIKKLLIEILGYYELGHEDISEQRMRTLTRTYKEMFDRPPYDRVKTFLSLIKKVMANPAIVHEDKFIALVEKEIRWLPNKEEDLQAMIFYGWLKSKMVGKPYYDIVLELTEEN